MSSDLRRTLMDLEHEVNALTLAPAPAVRARGEARRRHRQAALAIGVALVACVTVAAVSVGPRWPFTAGGPSTTACPPQPTLTNRPNEVRIFMKTEATRAQRDAVEARLRGWNLDPTVVDRQEAWRLFRIVYCANPDLLANTRAEQLPEFLIVTLPSSSARVQAELRSMPGVDTVVDLSPSSDRPTIPSCSAQPEATDGRVIHLDGRSAYVYLTQDSTDAQREAIADELRSLPWIASFSFSDHEDAYERFRRVYACEADLISGTRPESLEESFLVTLDDPARYPALRERVAGMPGVDTVIQIK